MTLAPICLFVYNRPEETELTLNALKANYLAKESELFVFCDGPKNLQDKEKVEKVRELIYELKGFKKVEIKEKEKNIGLANSIINGVTEIINKFGKIIVLEDDLVTSPNFLDFMNQALDFYKNFGQIHSISGYTLNLKSIRNLEYDNYFGRRASSWGWATWKDRWEKTDWEVKDFKEFRFNLLERLRFNRGGSDMSRMLINKQKGNIDSWAIRWCYSQFQNSQLTIYPKCSKVQNIGFGTNSTHTKKGKRFITNLDRTNMQDFRFDHNIKLNKKIDREYRSLYSILSRLKNRIIINK